MKPNFPDLIIPARIVIGVCGHRNVTSDPSIISKIQDAVKAALGAIPDMKHTPLEIWVLSPLAEGADRLIAAEILAMKSAKLTAVLPFAKDDYVNDFASEKSKNEFREFLNKATDIITLETDGNRIDAYENVGRFIVDQCDILIALWDEKPASGRGGTGDIIEYARKNGCPLIWIPTREKSNIVMELGNGLNTEIFRDLDRYNAEKINLHEASGRMESEYQFFETAADQSGLPQGSLSGTFKYLLFQQIRADTLASHYQRIHYGVDSIVAILALAAVMIASFQIIFLPEFPSILILEILLMLAVLVTVILSRYLKWHHRWMNYRFLAERIRSSLFLSITKFDVTSSHYNQRKNNFFSSGEWPGKAFISIWQHRPDCQNKDLTEYDAVRNFIVKAWIEPQILYHKKTSLRQHLTHHRLSNISFILFALTICTALLHIAHFHSRLLKSVLDFMTIIFPAIAASISAIRTQRDYQQNSIRSTEMAHRLSEIRNKIMLAPDYDDMLELLKELDQAMFGENEDWHIAVRLHKTEVPV